MKKIIVYGLGVAFKRNKEFLEEKFEVIGYSDQRGGDLRTIEPENIHKYEFDYVVIPSRKYYEEIKDELIAEYHVQPDKIISMFEIYREVYNIKSNNRSTSLSDDGIYPAFCSLAAKDEQIFAGFRRHPIIIYTYEHVTQSMGKDYLDVIEHNSGVTFSKDSWNGFAENDLYGLPYKYVYNIAGQEQEISPVTIRYIKVLQDIISLFDVENIKSIAEIGVSYGGQCRIIMDYLKIKEYSLIDLPEALELAKAYLSKYSLEGRVNYLDGTKDIEKKEFDLVISNYAFSELNRNIQDFYLDKIINRAAAGYITWNSLSYDQLDGYSLSELLGKIEGSYVLEERPLTYKNNCIIVWGDVKMIN